jgi:hypothetical protein
MLDAEAPEEKTRSTQVGRRSSMFVNDVEPPVLGEAEGMLRQYDLLLQKASRPLVRKTS